MEKVVLESNNKFYIVGSIVKNKFIMNRKREKHYYKKYGGYAINERIVNRLLNSNIKYIIINETDTNNRYWIDIDTFLSNSKTIQWNNEIQLCLPLEYFHQDKNKSLLEFVSE